MKVKHKDSLALKKQTLKKWTEILYKKAKFDAKKYKEINNLIDNLTK